jgi:hypothetical protein
MTSGGNRAIFLQNRKRSASTTARSSVDYLQDIVAIKVSAYKWS